MKNFFISSLHRMAQSPTMCRVLDLTFVKGADFYARYKLSSLKGADGENFRALQKRLSEELTVLHGPFAGMKYPSSQAAGSALIPKLLGSYEKELHPVLEHLLSKNYTEVIDVGCAEGYYAVGIARRLPNCKVTAYDLNPEARKLCRSMAELNGVADRVDIQTACSPETLQSYQTESRSLIICDCEAYEKQLFTPAVRDAILKHDILIETHDFLDITISSYLMELFKNTHRLSVISSVDDLHKARDYEYAELDGLSLDVKRKALAEDRPRAMEWFILEAKH